MDIKLIEKLMKDMDKSSLSKLEIEQDGFRICMEKNPLGVQVVEPAMTYREENDNLSETVHNNEDNETEPESQTLAHHVYITSPMVGTFYESVTPDQTPYLKVGDYVKKGQVVCIIESMKLMNEIEAEVEGEVTAILVTDKDMIEYGQKLFEILPR